MPGIVAGTVQEGELAEMCEQLETRPAFETEVFPVGEFGVALCHHGDLDPAGSRQWRDGDRAGVLYGVVTNLADLGLADDGELFEAVLDRPNRILPRLDGAFLVAATDGETGVLATDRLGTRPCFYCERGDGTALVGSNLGPLVGRLDEPTIDVRGLQTLVLLGHAWGERTLVEECRALQPASLLGYSDGELSETRYWTPDYAERPANRQYVDELTETYRTMMRESARSMTGDVGLWLSGGLDSRSMAAELSRYAGRDGYFDSLSAYTYDSNPRGARNPELARRVARVAGIPIDEVDVSADTLVDVVDRGIEATSGLLSWTAFTNVSAVVDVPADAHSVLLEGAGQGELMGQHLRRYHLTSCSPVESLYATEASVDVETARRVLAPSVDPFAAFKSTLRRSPAASARDVLKDVHFQNYYGKVQFANNQLVRQFVGTRVPYAHADFLSHAAQFPTEYRMGTFPLTGGTVPYGATKPKIEFMRQLDADLAGITYERTGVPPTCPFPVHVAGFVASTALGRLRSEPTYGAKSLPDVWYRTDRELQAHLDGLCDDACDRAVFDEAAIRDLQQEHLGGEANHVDVLAAVTTAESWLQDHVDG